MTDSKSIEVINGAILNVLRWDYVTSANVGVLTGTPTLALEHRDLPVCRLNMAQGQFWESRWEAFLGGGGQACRHAGLERGTELGCGCHAAPKALSLGCTSSSDLHL